jgi:DNA-binding response OmpR family regulator
MVRSFPHSLLAAAVAIVVGGSALAQNTPLQEAIILLRLNKPDEAVQKLREILTSDPSNTDALKLYESVTQDEWYLLMTTKGEVQQIAQSILDRAKVETKQRSRDEAAINALVATATAKDSDHPTRQTAINKLIANHGEFAVPALVNKLGDDDAEGQIQAIYTLQQLGACAVLPLIEALKSSSNIVVQNAAAALHQIGDSRAIPAMVGLANDVRPNVAAIAHKFLAKKAAGGNTVDLLVAQANDYLEGRIPFGAASEVVWTLKNDKLVFTDVLPLLYPSELAKACAADAVRINPASLAARSMLVEANVAQAYLIDTSIAQGDAAFKPLEPVSEELKITALATGTDALRSALDAGVKRGMAPVAIGSIQALAKAESIPTIDQSSLVAALNSSDKRIKYAAAHALVSASGGAHVPQSDRVVAVLADAVAEEAVRTIQVIAPAVEAAAAVESTSKVRGFAVDSSASAVSGMHSLLVNPNIDVVVINEILPDQLPETVIGNIKKDPRMANTRVVVIAKDEEAAKPHFANFGDVSYVKAPLTGENLVAAVNKALEGSTNPGNARAEAYAANASNSLLAFAAQKGDIGPALTNLGMQLNRSDAVSVPAAKALGLAGGEAQLAPLVTALGGSGSLDLKKAAAEAIGNVLGRLDHCPADVGAALATVLNSSDDVGLRAAAAVAFGKAKIDNAKKAEMLNKLNRIAAGPAGG